MKISRQNDLQYLHIPMSLSSLLRLLRYSKNEIEVFLRT